MRSFVVVMALLLAGFSACGKKTYKRFYELDARQSVLIASQGDSAYELPEMDDLIIDLEAVPENAREKDRAIALVTKLKAERARVKAETALAETPINPTSPTPPSSPSTVDRPLASPRPAGTVDAGPPEPYAGMSLDDFRAQFGACFQTVDPIAQPDGSKAAAELLLSSTECQARFHGAGDKTFFLFKDDKLFATRSETLSRVILDAGVKAPERPALPPGYDGGTVLYVPGGPRPPGSYQREVPEVESGAPQTGADAPPAMER